MNRETTPSPRAAQRLGGAALIAATVLFAAVFTWLALHFGYPDVLDRPAAEVLPRLLALGDAGRAVWAVYGLIPLLLLPAARGIHAAGRQAAPVAARVAVAAALLSTVCMMAGLLRWPTLQWQLALDWAAGPPDAHAAIAAAFGAANRWLGNVMGEFFGELFLNTFFFSATLVLSAAPGRRPRWLLAAGTVASALGFIAMLRNLLPSVAPVAELNNTVLPLWMATLGVALWRHRGAA